MENSKKGFNVKITRRKNNEILFDDNVSCIICGLKEMNNKTGILVFTDCDSEEIIDGILSAKKAIKEVERRLSFVDSFKLMVMESLVTGEALDDE